MHSINQQTKGLLFANCYDFGNGFCFHTILFFWVFYFFPLFLFRGEEEEDGKNNCGRECERERSEVASLAPTIKITTLDSL